MATHNLNLFNTVFHDKNFTKKEQQVLSMICLLAREGTELSALRDVMPIDPRELQTHVNTLVSTYCVYYRGMQDFISLINLNLLNAEDVFADAEIINKTLERLEKFTTLSVTDTLADKRCYFTMQKRLLMFIYDNRDHLPEGIDKMLIARNTAKLMYHYDLAFNNDYKIPDNVATPHEKFVVVLIDFVCDLLPPIIINQNDTATNLVFAELLIHLARFYNKAFCYRFASMNICSAEQILKRYKEEPEGQRLMIELQLANAEYFYLRTQFSKWALSVHKAYKQAKATYGEESVETARVMMEIARTFASLGKYDDAQLWRQKAMRILPKPLSEDMRIIELITHAGNYSIDLQKGLRYMDQAEALAVCLYGQSSSKVGEICYLRYYAYAIWSLHSKAEAAYARYIHCNHINYGTNIDGDTILAFADRVYHNMIKGYVCNATLYTQQLIFNTGLSQLFTENKSEKGDQSPTTNRNILIHKLIFEYSPAVVASFYQALLFFWPIDKGLTEYMELLDDEFIDYFIKLFLPEGEEEMEAIDAITTAKSRDCILGDSMMYTMYFIKHRMHETRDYCGEEEVVDEIKALIDKWSFSETSYIRMLELNLSTLDTSLDADTLWDDIVAPIAPSHRFRIGMILANLAINDDELQMALRFYELSLDPENLLGAYTSDIINLSIDYAKALMVDGQTEKAENIMAQAEYLAKSVEDNEDLMVHVYKSWGRLLEDVERFDEALEKASKALSHKKSRDNIFDEETTYLLIDKAAILSSLSRYDESREYYLKAIDMYPSHEYPHFANLLMPLIDIEMRQKRYSEARSHILQALKIDLEDNIKGYFEDMLNEVDLYDPQNPSTPSAP